MLTADVETVAGLDDVLASARCGLALRSVHKSGKELLPALYRQNLKPALHKRKKETTRTWIDGATTRYFAVTTTTTRKSEHQNVNANAAEDQKVAIGFRSACVVICTVSNAGAVMCIRGALSGVEFSRGGVAPKCRVTQVTRNILVRLTYLGKVNVSRSGRLWTDIAKPKTLYRYSP